ncbi:MAG: VTT domain-containing protein [Candidatus Caldarchaeum sp.]|nr:VTT domain-containing protein [Candidatus Caldarchaeum sp.]MCX8201398.1 VTT domain-containing protein [Candidatus Caldarchaeum sp.]MDW8063888.1 VTT domain-containing protein [Candidatus Caldarchaeum sp.]MDW8435421.1 VTT domain-containing protein [Candidatus Caldarchaeum sp.]
MDFFSPGFWDSFTAYGYLGVFAASLLGSLLPFVSGPYIPPIILAVIAGKLDPLPTAFSSAAGAAIAKLVLFRFFKSGRILISPETQKRIEPLEKLVAKHGWLAVVGASATPLPDDVVFVLLAIANYSSKLFLPTVFAGKLIITTAVSYVALYWGNIACYIVECAVGEINITQTLLIAVATAAAAMAAVYLLTRLDWQKIFTKIGLKTENP